MTGQADLERGYRRLLAWYPRAFRQENGPEILAVLMAAASDGQHRPGMTESADLVRSGLRMRLWPSGQRSARTVRAAVGLMYAGAAVSTATMINYVYLTIALASIDDNKIHYVHLPELGNGAMQVPPLNLLVIALGFAGDLAVVALWLWMAQATAQRQNWVRIAATVLFILATLEASAFLADPLLIAGTFAPGGVAGLLTWPVGAAAVCLLWCPASTAFFRRPDLPPVQPPDFPANLALPGSEGARTARL
jgi:hypothetical protein